MPVSGTRIVFAVTLVLLAGLVSGLSLGSAQQPIGTVEQLITTTDPGVPTASVPVETSKDATSALTTETVAPDTTDTAAVTPTATATVVTQRPAPVSGAAVGAAQLADPAVQRREYAKSCAARPPATSPLLGSVSTVSGRDGGGPRWLLPGVALLAALVAIAAIAWRLRGASPEAREAPKPKTALEIVSASVAILGTLATLAVAYFGTGAKDHPPPSVAMTVREVHSRITHGAFAGVMPRQTEALSRIERREIGNVVWLELRFTGLRDTDLTLQTAAFRAGPGQPLIPNTRRAVPIHVDDRSDVHTEFRPVWIGSPRVPRFRAEFRIVDADGDVRQIASTGPMKGIAYRYAC